MCSALDCIRCILFIQLNILFYQFILAANITLDHLIGISHSSVDFINMPVTTQLKTKHKLQPGSVPSYVSPTCYGNINNTSTLLTDSQLLVPIIDTPDLIDQCSSSSSSLDQDYSLTSMMGSSLNFLVNDNFEISKFQILELDSSLPSCHSVHNLESCEDGVQLQRIQETIRQR
jgi:hypothetical protein